MTGDAWGTNLGQWALAWRDYLRGEPIASEISVAPELIVESADRCSATHIGHDGSAERCRERASHPNTDGWHIDEWGSGWRDAPESADAAFAREIALAHEVCDEQVAADAAVAFAPDVPLPFGGKES